MSIGHHLPVSETLGVFVGVAGFDWLTEGQAEPLKALTASIIAGIILAAARLLWANRHKG
ncbi:MAG: hypothetical protein WAV95_19175 [Azonexus sp.]